MTSNMLEREGERGGAPDRAPDVIYVPTPQPVVDRMLELSHLGPDDFLIDLGSGDGRLPITAAQRWGTRGIGIDIDPARVAEATRHASEAGVSDLVEFFAGDLFEIDLARATVVTLYLLPEMNWQLMPALQALAKGTRIASHNYGLGRWEPDATETIGTSTLFVWTVR